MSGIENSLSVESLSEMSITFDRLGYQYKSKTILDEISGTVQPGEFVAIMGPSGSGKTTLMNILGGRLKDGVAGTHLINGSRPKKKEIGFVLQDDILFPNLTVEQTLNFTAEIRNPDWSPTERKEELERLTNLLGISHIIKSKIGSEEKRGISGGEKRRVNICNELLSFPRILFLDEPTSGLDTATAIHLLEALKELAQTGVTVVFSIHQPPAQAYGLFDKLLFLIDGRLVYSGPPAGLKSHFKVQKIKYDRHLNPADYIMKMILEDKTDQFKNRLIESWQGGPDLEIGASDEPSKARKQSHPLKEIHLLAKRSFFQNLVRLLDPADNILLIVRSLVMGMILFQLIPHHEHIEEAAGTTYLMIITISSFIPAYAGLTTFMTEHLIIQRELNTGTYRLYSYYIAKTLSDIPYLILHPTLFLIIFYWMAGFKPTFEAFIFCYAIIISNSFTSNAMGLVFSIITRDTDQAGKILDSTFMIMSYMAGFWARRLPIWLSWIQYIVPIGYGYQALLLNEFQGKEYLHNGTVILRGDEYLQGFTIWTDQKWIYLIGILLWDIFYRVVAYVCLKISFKTKSLKCT